MDIVFTFRVAMYEVRINITSKSCRKHKQEENHLL